MSKFKLEGSRFKTVYVITCYGGLVAPLKSTVTQVGPRSRPKIRQSVEFFRT